MGRSNTGFGIRDRFQFTASGSETSVSGSDDNGRTLKFADGKYVDVYLNGVLLVDNTDYNTLLEMWREEKKKREKVEEELEKLKADLARAEEDRQYDNLVHQRELADLFKGKYEKE